MKTPNICPICSKPARFTYCSLSCSSKSKLGKNETRYNLSPNRCPRCQNGIPYAKRFRSNFCSHSCAAKTNNLLRGYKPKKAIELKHPTTLERFELGKLTDRKTIKKCLKQINGPKCNICSQEPIWLNKPLVMVLDHINGDASNNSPSNLQLLCPHCNSQTSTFSGRNKGYGRKSRGLAR